MRRLISLFRKDPIHKKKRVSFGNDAVKTFVYEKDSDDPTPVLQKMPFTDPDAPVSRVTVTSETVRTESPSPIAPPAQIEEIRKTAVSPPLPTKKMAEHDNPFRPEEVLFHEVDPIVEQYLQKPFPPSRPGSAQNTPIKEKHEMSLEDENNASPAYLQNGLSKDQLIQNEKAEAKQPLLDKRNSNDDKKSSGVDYTDDLPPAQKVELIHVKRKKCGCCTVQ